MRKMHQRGAQITKKIIGGPSLDGSARISGKRTRRVNKSPKIIITLIPGNTPEHAKNAREAFTNYAKTSVVQYFMGVPEYP